MAPYVNMDLTVSHPPPLLAVFHRYCITTGKIHPWRFFRFFWLLAHPNATWQRLDLLSGREQSCRRFTQALIPGETKEERNLGRQQRCWNICKKTKTKHSLLTLHNEIPSKEAARSLSGTVFRPQREFTSDCSTLVKIKAICGSV